MKGIQVMNIKNGFIYASVILAVIILARMLIL